MWLWRADDDDDVVRWLYTDDELILLVWLWRADDDDVVRWLYKDDELILLLCEDEELMML